jgi:flagellar assembly protein FliH
MTAFVGHGEVLRGMHLEPQAVRVGRRHAGGPSTNQADSMLSADQVESRRAALDTELARARADAQRAGYEDGLRQGLREAEGQAQTAAANAVARALVPVEEQKQKLARLQASVTDALAQALRLAEDEMVALCFETICRMVGEAGKDPETLRAQVRVLAAQVGDHAGLAVHVHPQDAEILLASLEQEPAGLRWIADAEVTLGGCIVKHSAGGLDARLDKSLAACRDSLLASRERRLRSQEQS